MAERFTAEDVARIARLARVALSRRELERFAPQLSEFLAYAEHVREVDTSGVPPTAHPLDAIAPRRSDEVRPSLAGGDALAASPDRDDARGLFKVPRVLGA